MKQERIKEVIAYYNEIVGNVEARAQEEELRAYGGLIRSEKGSLVERIGKALVRIAWEDVLKQESDRLKFLSRKFKIPMKIEYIDRIEDPELKNYIRKNLNKFYYEYKPDISVAIDGVIVMFFECKSYTENAMFKRILVDFTLLKTIFPTAKFFLLQLESQLGGDFSKLGSKTYGSPQTHTLLSYFDIDIEIVTLLKGERKVDKPIHKPKFFKPLTKKALLNAITKISEALKPWQK
ncbi:hypothetical protein [Candidatus Chrysopegis kryptomonas]|jgi:hypothetical protein|uniref:Type II restriction enzyme n=1 Tax=Candidatus Chryseopegocella kryptomonas TaxID=1633643 RepID=A0A0P1MSS9_9BACT|nr:hypothetical protein [Candidatus Chrysopegis kryptomonas]CUS98761.1 hypothetical protein JGI23_00552 [Candidatus Chrysopegis kryptomonas]